ncbi:hypothetical protein [Flindersiella endophytica]
MSTPPTPEAGPAYPPPGPYGMPPPPARNGMPKWVIALIIVAVLVFVAVPVVALALAGLGLFHFFRPPAASDTPPEPGFRGFDVCSLITPRDAERAGARLINLGPETVTVVGRVVETNEAGVPVDTCEYGTEPSNASDVTVSVTPAADLAAKDLLEVRRVPVSGIGDEAYQVYGKYYGFKLIARKGTTQLTIETRKPYDGQERDEVNQQVRLVTDLGRKAIAKVPAKLTLPAAVAKGPCESVDAKAITEALGGPVAYSRSLEDENATVCSYAAANGHGVAFRLKKDVDDSERDVTDDFGDPITIGDRDAYQLLGTIAMLGTSTKLEIAFDYYSDTGRLTSADRTLAAGAADKLLD